MSVYLGIETSCDDTSMALVSEKGEVLKLLKYTNDEDHKPFGGIVPERASRNHLKSIAGLLSKLSVDFQDLSGVGYTSRPGLVGSLIVGAVAAKTLSQVYDLELFPVNHIEGHLLSPWLFDKGGESTELVFPHLSLVVSGGHSQLVLAHKFGSYSILGSTRDDAVGEAIDKFSKAIGLGFPGGPMVDKKSQGGDLLAYDFPRPMMKEPNYDFSFSGLKASAFRLIEEKKVFSEKELSNVSASYLNACVEVLEYKTKKAILEFKPKALTVVGGVSANSLLRERFKKLSEALSVPLIIPPLKYCTDNGAMIAFVTALHLSRGVEAKKELRYEPHSRSWPEDFIDQR